MEFRGLLLDNFQEKAISAIEKNHSVIVSAPTGSGKTLIADYIIDRDIKEGKRVIYTSPIKALSNQKFRDFCESYGDDKIGLITGDIVINPLAEVVIMTTEVYRNMAIINDHALNNVRYCIMDEIHYIADVERGHVWEESIIFSHSKVRFLLLSATIPNAHEFAAWVEKIKEHKVEVVTHKTRPVPLDIMFYDSDLGITSLEKIEERKELDEIPDYKDLFSKRQRHRGARVKPPEFGELIKELKGDDKLPCIYFVLSRQKAQDYAQKIESLLNQEEKVAMGVNIRSQFQRISDTVAGLKSTGILRTCLAKGVGFHHAGMLPDVKHIVERLFSEGLIKVLFATETFAVGINMPAKTVCFDSLRKYTGTDFRYFNSKEFFQLAGRAGRRGMDKVGYAIAMIYRPNCDFQKIREFTGDDTLPLKSQFRISYNSVLNMINQHSQTEIEQILKMSFYTFQEGHGMPIVRARYENLLKELTKLGYVKDGKLTEIGLFTTKIFSDEILVSQLFYRKEIEMDEYTILLVVGCLAYEERRDYEFKKKYESRKVIRILKAVERNPYLRDERWGNMEAVISLVHPLYEQKKFPEIIKNTTMPEGDLIRFYMQMLDKLEQIDRASLDENLRQMIRNCKHLIKNSLEGIHVF